ncbi:Primosomal replication protein N [Candidatus Erwinia haradaeae]|uniref:Primosomal replication protein N n=1 Tax=Candidatus Erwinia haradaeae TaxID=1922217 RepID=A0A451DAK8_9GAMM|nr:primosomal replication protein N [Candidatus Erwinia haradaeae]VFP83253.1 Primosomal replication protein N [Candidatus Erwinia haradaeae]
MKENWSTLSGVVHREPRRGISPSGIRHFQFILEHRSQQKEADLNRRVWCWMPVVMSLSATHEMPSYIMVGVWLNVQGFLSCHKNRYDLNRIVLHAKNIELIKSGE